MADRAAELLRKKLEAQEARTERLRTILRFFEEDPDLVTELFEILKDPKTNGWVPPVRFQKDLGPNPNLEPILAAFKAKGEDKWVSVSELVEATGLNRHTINLFLREGRHRDLFETDLPNPKRRYFRVKKKREDDSKPAEGPKRKRSQKKPTPVEPEGKNIIRPKWGPANAKFVRVEGSEDTKPVK